MAPARSCDVLVLGGGVSGLATAIHLSLAGLVPMVGTLRRDQPTLVGECLAPSSNPLIRALGVWGSFQKDGHLPCYGNESAWGSPDLRMRSHFGDPHGHGWHIHRGLFEAMLAERVEAMGHPTIWTRRPPTVERLGGSWRVQFADPDLVIRCPFLVDATGRSSWLARRLGGVREYEERQVALVVFFEPTGRPMTQTTTLVEAVESGWWYTGLLPGGALVAAFMTDPRQRAAAELSHQWDSLLEETHHTHERVEGCGYRPSTIPSIVDATGGHLDRPVGDGWLAVGDAALTFDPIAGHGVTAALAAGRDAAGAIGDTLGGRPALTAYARRLEKAHSVYARARRAILAEEARWPSSLFWAARQRWGDQAIWRLGT